MLRVAKFVKSDPRYLVAFVENLQMHYVQCQQSKHRKIYYVGFLQRLGRKKHVYMSCIAVKQ